MKLSESSKWFIFGVLIFLIFLSLYFSSNSRPVISSNSQSRQPGKTSSPDSSEVPLMQKLALKTPIFRDVKRNVFQFRDGGQSEIAAAPKVEVPPVVTSTPALPDVRYLGFYKQKDESRILLAAISNGGKIYVGGVGEILADKYEVIQIDDEFLVLRILATNQIMRFDLGKSGNTPAIPQ